jgi:hypothetical protein
MNHRPLGNTGNTGIAISPIAFGAGPVSALLTGDDRRRQIDVVAAAIGERQRGPVSFSWPQLLRPTIAESDGHVR